MKYQRHYKAKVEIERKKERKQSDGLVRVRGLGERNDDA